MIGRDRLGRAFVALGAWIVAAFVPLLFHRTISVMAVVFAIATAVCLYLHHRTIIRLEDDALVVVSVRGTKRFAWKDILEVSWVRGSSFVGSGPVLRVKGGPYEEPGPNLPAKVGSVLLFSKRSNREAAEVLAGAAASHGIPFTADLQRLINQGKRRPRLSGEPADSTKADR